MPIPLRPLLPVGRLALLSFIVLLLFSPLSSATPAIPVPYISGVSPVAVVPGGADFTVTINGANFRQCSAQAYWGSTLLSTTFVSTSKLTATVPASLIAAGGTGWITVQNTGNPIKSNVAYLPVAHPAANLKFAQFNLPTGNNPLELAQADLNGDGKLDLVVSDYGSNTIEVFLGNGDGTFQTSVPYTTSSEPFGIAIGDLNGDGKLDLVVGHDGYDINQGLDVLLGNGDGTFQAAQHVNVPTYEPINPSLADLNGDGKLDLIIPDWDGSSVFVLLGNGDGTFQDAQALGSNYSSWNVAIGDFNEDGILDLAVPSEGSQSVNIFLGNGDGTFGDPQPYATGSYGFFISAGDLNGDGHTDLILGSEEGNSSILLGNGDGTFLVAAPLPQNYSYSNTLADVNADGHLDFISASSSTTVNLGNGDGTFLDAQNFSNGSFSYGVVAAPFASGGGIGIATTDFGSNSLIILLQTVSLSPASVDFGNQPTGATSSAQVVTVTNSTSNTVNISGVSFTGDNAGDFAQTNNCGSSLASGATCTINVTFTPGASGARSAILNLADDAPASPQTIAIGGTGVSSAVAVLTPTGQDFGSILVGSSSLQKTVNLQNTGNIPLAFTSIQIAGANPGDFTESDNCGSSVAAGASCTLTLTFVPTATGARAASVTLADNASDSPQSVALTGIGLQAGAFFSANSLSFASQSLGSPTVAQTITVTSTGSSALLIANISASGDFSQSNNCPVSLAIASSCAIQVTFTPTAVGPRTGNLTVSDSDPSSPQTITLTGTGTLAPAAVPFISSISPVATLPGGDDLIITVNGTGFVARSLVNWNGTPLATVYVSNSKLTAVLPAALTATLGASSLTVSSGAPAGGVSNLFFLPVSTTVSPLALGAKTFAAGNGSAFLAQGDFNGDGKLDLVATNNADGTVSVLLGNGDGTFQTQQTFTAVPGVVGVAVGDVNGDGKLDIVVGQQIQGNVCENYSVIGVLLGNGDGTFQAPQTFTAQEGALFPVLGDINGDGKLDIVVANEYSDSISILLGNGDGTFQAAQTPEFNFQDDVLFSALADLNGDGQLDLLVTGQESGNLFVLLGNGDGTFQAPQSIETGDGALGLAVADINGDGKLDVAVANGQSAAVAILLGNGDGTFQEPQSVSVPNGPISVAFGDIDGDGKLDLLVGSLGSGVSLALGNGDGTFAARQDFPGTAFSYSLITGNYASGLGLGIASTNFETSQISVLYPTVVVTPATLDFGSLAVGSSSSPQTVTLTNPTLGSINITGVSITGDNNTDFAQTNDCTANFAAASSCTFHITFAPQSLGSRVASLSLADTAFGGSQTVALTGSSLSATATLSVSSLTFDPRLVGSASAAQTVTLTNSGNNALTVTGITVTGTNSADFAQTNDCGSSVAAGAFCTVTVTFTPSASGSRGAAISIVSSASEATESVTLQGTGQDFTLALSGGQTVVAGNTASFQLSVTPVNGFNQTVALTCSGAPAMSTCTVSPSSITPDGITATHVTVTLTTTGKSLLTPQNVPPAPQLPLTGLRLQITLVFLALLVLLIRFSNAEKFYAPQAARLLLASAALVLVALTMAACGSKHTPSGGTPAGAYTVTVTATAGSISHSSTAQLTVQ